MMKLLKWLDDNLIRVLAGFLLIFIPLYPKLPLADILPGYIVRVRLEDLFVALTFLLWIVWVLRGKIKISGIPLLKPIIIYLLVGMLSILSAIFIIKTIPLETIHVLKILLHYIRRIEYFSLFFILFTSVKNFQSLKIYFWIYLLSILGVTIYGFGQKYYYWPAFSTMNREFSKGWVLYLSEHARVLSTFGGHYDLAAFIMMALIMLWSIFFGLKKWLSKTLIFILIAASFWTLILTASRTSFLAYIFGITIMFFFWAYKKGIKWSLSRWFIVTVLSIVIMLSFGDLSERFTKLLRIDDRISGIKSLLRSPIGKPPTDKAFFLENNEQAILNEITSRSDQPPSTSRPSDVYEDIPLNLGSASASIAAIPRSYSRNAFMYDLSTAIRFDALWPMAIKGFQRNILLGSGYSTLNKSSFTNFTEAESTDNDYLRALGETGLFGFISFYGILFFIIYYIWRNITILNDSIFYSLAFGLGGLIFGLLINAVYIDVFESSKVAFTFWALTGLILSGIHIIKKNTGGKIPYPQIMNYSSYKKSFKNRLSRFIKSDFLVLAILIVLAFTLRIYKINTPLADWHSWRQSDTSSVTRNFIKNGVNLLYPTYDDLSNIASGKDNLRGLRYVEFPIYNFLSVIVDKLVPGYSIEISGRLTSIFASLGTLILIYYLAKKYGDKKLAVLSGLFFAVLPYNIYFSRVILPEPLLVFASTGMIFTIDLFLEKISEFRLQKKTFSKYIKLFSYFILALLFSVSSFLIKPYAVFLLLPVLYLWYRHQKLTLKSGISFIIFVLISVLPFLLWRRWMNNFPEGIPASQWLLNGDGIRFKGAFFYWIFADRIVRLISGYYGIVFIILGIIAPKSKEKSLFDVWLLSMLLYVTVFATGNVRHDYYQILLIPIISIFLAKGVLYFFNQGTNLISRFKNYSLIIILFIFMEMFGWYFVRDYYNINHPEIVEAGNRLERISNSKSLVIAPYNGDTAFLYQTNRAGWPIVQDSMDKMIQRGADYYVSVTFDDLTKQLIRDSVNPNPEKNLYKLVELTDKYVIIQLVPDSKLPK